MNANKLNRQPRTARSSATRSAVSHALDALESRRLMTNFVVTNTNDAGAGSLRAAILSANAALGQDTISFNIASDSKRIKVSSQLPSVTDAAIIDGTTQPGFAPGSLMIDVNGFNAPTGSDGLVWTANGGTIKGLMFSGFKAANIGGPKGNGIVLDTASRNVTVQGNYIGTTGSVGIGMGGSGIVVYSDHNTIRNNVVASNAYAGVLLTGSQATDNVVAGNSTQPNMGNGKYGIAILDGASNNTIGGTGPTDHNLLSSNKEVGLWIGTTDGAPFAPTGNKVIGNWVGLDNDGLVARPNYFEGIKVTAGTKNEIGGSNTGEGNVIFAATMGVALTGASEMRVIGNRIGMNVASDVLMNGGHGIEVGESTHDIQIGGATAGERNWIVNKGGTNGIRVGDGSFNVKVRGNVVGLTPTEKSAASADVTGISVSNHGTGVVIGGPNAGDGNIIANADVGIAASDSMPGLLIQGNQIGLNLAGTADGGGGANGISVGDGNDVQVLDNTIGGVGGTAIYMGAAGAVRGNRIGLDRTGLLPISVNEGISLGNGVSPTIGGTAAGQANVFGMWAGAAIKLTDVGDVPILGNQIGVNVAGQKMPGGSVGIAVVAASAIIGGTSAGAGNLIVSAGRAIELIEANVTVQGNTIGQPGMPNGTGIYLESDTDALIGGDVAAAGNTIAYSTGKAIVTSNDAGLITIRRNAIYSNGGLAIDLHNNGLTNNDPGDADTGANGLQNFPLLLSADSTAGNATTLTGVINTTAGTPLVLDFYAADVAANEARVWLGSKTIVTDGGGGATFNVTLPFVAGNKFIVATATNLLNAPQGATSELSPAIAVVGPADATAPSVTGGTMLFQTGHAVKLVFNEELLVNSIGASDLQMKNTTTNQSFTPGSFAYDAGTKAITFAFSSTLPDGNYTFTLPAGAVSDAAGNATASPFSDKTFILAGDANRDRAVGFDDLLTLAKNYGKAGKTFGEGNFSYDAGGNVGFDDLLMLAKNYGKSIAAAAPAAAMAASTSPTRQRVADSIFA